MMDKNNYQSMDLHISLLGWLHIAMHSILLLVGGIAFLAIVGGGLLSGDAEAMTITPLVGTAVGGLFFVLAAPGVLAGIGLLKRKPWARILTLVLGLLNLMSFPVGTAVGVYTLWILLQNDASDHFLTAKIA